MTNMVNMEFEIVVKVFMISAANIVGSFQKFLDRSFGDTFGFFQKRREEHVPDGYSFTLSGQNAELCTFAIRTSDQGIASHFEKVLLNTLTDDVRCISTSKALVEVAKQPAEAQPLDVNFA